MLNLLGWKREIVLRSGAGQAAKRKADVYYYSPSGTKFRSSKQLATYCMNSYFNDQNIRV